MSHILTSRVAAALLAALTFCSCRATYPERTAATGALIGAGTGALIGSASGNAGKGALIGAAAGGIAGGVYGRQRVKQHYRGYYDPLGQSYGPHRRAPMYYPTYAYPGPRVRRPLPVVYAPRPYRYYY